VLLNELNNTLFCPISQSYFALNFGGKQQRKTFYTHTLINSLVTDSSISFRALIISSTLGDTSKTDRCNSTFVMGFAIPSLFFVPYPINEWIRPKHALCSIGPERLAG